MYERIEQETRALIHCLPGNNVQILYHCIGFDAVCFLETRLKMMTEDAY